MLIGYMCARWNETRKKHPNDTRLIHSRCGGPQGTSSPSSQTKPLRSPIPSTPAPRRSRPLDAVSLALAHAAARSGLSGVGREVIARGSPLRLQLRLSELRLLGRESRISGLLCSCAGRHARLQAHGEGVRGHGYHWRLEGGRHYWKRGDGDVADGDGGR